jgi:Inner membrane protein YgaP-like, transmembrane domain
MKRNLSNTDRLIRLGLSVILFVLWLQNIIIGVGGVIALVIAGVLAVTSLISFCPLYRMLGISSCEHRKHA